VGVGAALAARLECSNRRVFVLMSDAECNEGSVWEAAMFAAHHRLGRLTAIIDLNGQQALGATADVLSLAPMVERWRAFGWDAREVDGHDGATSFMLAAQHSPIHVVGSQSFDPNASDYRSLATGVKSTRANCVLISAITDSNAAAVTNAIGVAMPSAKIFGSAGLAESTFTDAAQGGISTTLDPQVMITAPTLDPAAYPAAAEAFYNAYAHAYGTPQPDAIYGYEAMSLMLSAIARASDGGRKPVRRSKVLQALFSTRDRHSVLGTYSIQRDGDTTLRRYGAYRIVDGQLSFWTAIDA